MASFSGQFSQSFDVTNDGTVYQKHALSTDEKITAIRTINRLRQTSNTVNRMRFRMQSALFKDDAIVTEKSIDIVAKSKTRDNVDDQVLATIKTVKTQLKGIPDDDPSVQESQRQSSIIDMLNKQKEKFMPKLDPRMITSDEVNRMNMYFRMMHLTKNQNIEIDLRNARFRSFISTGIQMGAIVGVGVIALSSLNLIALGSYLNPTILAWLHGNLTTISYEVFMTVIPAASELGKNGLLASARTVVTSLGTRYILENVDIKMAIVKTVAPGFDALNLPFLGTIVGRGTLMITQQGMTGLLNGVAHFKTAKEIADETQRNTIKEMEQRKQEFDKLVEKIGRREYDPIEEAREHRQREMEEKMKYRAEKNHNASWISKVLRIPVQVVKMVMKLVGYGWRELRVWSKKQSKVALITTGIVSSGVAAFMFMAGLPITDQAYQITNGFLKNTAPALVMQTVLTKTQLVPKLAKLLEDWVLRSIGKKDIAEARPVVWMRRQFEKMLGRQLDWQLKVSTLVSMMLANQLATSLRQSMSSIFDLDNLSWLVDRWDTTLVFTQAFDAFTTVLRTGSFEKFNVEFVFQSLYEFAGTIHVGSELYKNVGELAYTIKSVDYSTQKVVVSDIKGQQKQIDVKSSTELDNYYIKNENQRLIPVTIGNMILPSLDYYQFSDDISIDSNLLTFINKNDPQSLQTLLDLTADVKSQVGEMERLRVKMEEMVDTISESERFIDSDMGYEPSSLDTIEQFDVIKRILLTSIVRSKTEFVRAIFKDRSDQDALQYGSTMLGTLSSDTSKELVFTARNGTNAELESLVERIITVENKWIASEPIVERMTRRMVGLLSKDGPSSLNSQWSAFIKPLQFPNQTVLTSIADQFERIQEHVDVERTSETLIRSLTIDTNIINVKGTDGKTLMDDTIKFMAIQKARGMDSLTAIQQTTNYVTERYAFYNLLRVKANMVNTQWVIPESRLSNLTDSLTTLFETSSDITVERVVNIVDASLNVDNIFDQNEKRSIQNALWTSQISNKVGDLVGPVVNIVQNAFNRHVAMERSIEMSSPMRDIVARGMTEEYGVVSSFTNEEWRLVLQSATKANFFPDYKSVSSMQTQRVKAMNSFNQGFYDHAIDSWEGLLSNQKSQPLDTLKELWVDVKREVESLANEKVPKDISGVFTSDSNLEKGWWKRAFDLEIVKDRTFLERVNYAFRKSKNEYDNIGILDAVKSLATLEGEPSDALRNLANSHRNSIGLPSLNYSNSELVHLDTSSDPGLSYVANLLDVRLPSMKSNLARIKSLSRNVDNQVNQLYLSESTLIKDRQLAKNEAIKILEHSQKVEDEWKQVSQKVVREMQKFKMEQEVENRYAERFGIRSNPKKMDIGNIASEIQRVKQTVIEAKQAMLPINSPKILSTVKQEEAVRIDLTRDEIIVSEQKQQLMNKIGEDASLANQIHSIMVYSQNYASGLDLSLMTKFASLFGYGGTEFGSKVSFSTTEMDRLKNLLGGYKSKLLELQQKLEQNPKMKDMAKCLGASYRMKWPSGEVDPPEYANCYMEAFAGTPSHVLKYIIIDGGTTAVQSLVDLISLFGPAGVLTKIAISAAMKAALLTIKVVENAFMLALISAAPKFTKMIEQNLKQGKPDPTMHYWRFLAAWACGAGGSVTTTICKGSGIAPGKLDGIPLAKFALRDVLLSSSSLVEDENFANIVRGLSGQDENSSPFTMITSLWHLIFNVDNKVVKTLLLGDVKSSHLRQYWDRWDKEHQWHQSQGLGDLSIMDYFTSLKEVDIDLSKGVLTTMEQLATLLSYLKRLYKYAMD